MEKQKTPCFNVEFPKLPDAELMQKYVIDFDKEARCIPIGVQFKLVANGLLAEYVLCS